MYRALCSTVKSKKEEAEMKYLSLVENWQKFNLLNAAE